MPPQHPASIGRYVIEQTIGRGGMGVLYLATDPALGRRVAVKVLRGEDSDDLRARFSREARALAGLVHRNIVAIYDVGEHDGHPFIAMEYVEGGTLAELIRARTPLSLQNKIAIVEDLCEAIGYAHGKGVVHRDIKPANVMIDPAGTVKVLDFGIARISSSDMTHPGLLIGTPDYMAPEQVQGHAVDARTDIYAVGVLLYQLLALRPPFVAPDTIGVMWKVVNGKSEPLSSVVPDVPPALAAIVDRAMAVSPDARYQALDDMRADLGRVRTSLPADLYLTSDGTPATMVPGHTMPGVRNAGTLAGISAPPVALAPSSGSETAYLGVAAPAGLSPDLMPGVQLVVLHGPDARMNARMIAIASPRFSIGRDASCDLALADPRLSRRHASIEYGPGGFMLVDNGSGNGTFLNGRRVRASGEPVTFGATIQVGDTALTFALSSDARLPDLTGVLLAGRYALARLLREGVKGAVYEARDRHVGKNVAVKLLPPDLMRFDAYRQQFEREADIGASLHHPHICQVLDRGEEDVSLGGGPALHVNYLCLELMSGGSLTSRLQESPLPLPEIASIVSSVAGALDYAHQQGVVHGDVKPSAVVFSQDGHVYLTDFAFAQRALSAGEGPSLGSPAYVAPEVWEHGALTAASDQFALAVLAYYAIAGVLPFAGQDNPIIRHKNFAQGPIAVHQEAAPYRNEPVPKTAAPVLARALARTPEERFPSGSAFAAALLVALEGRRADRGGPRIFLSYHRESGAGWANFFARELKDHGIATFLDVQQIDRAERFSDRLSRAIDDCDVFVCLLGATTLHSPWVLEEIRQAVARGKPMVPIFQESFDPAEPGAADPAVAALLSHDAVHLFDERNVHVAHSAADLATLIKNTIDRAAD